jgi:hypothetical protein
MAFPVLSSNDSMLFNLSEADCFSDKIAFPVYIDTDEDIYALDFALKYNSDHIQYDSIIILKPYLFASVFFNTADSTLRLSAFSISPVEALSDLFILRFRKMLPVIDSIGFSSVITYLNGDSCSNRVSPYTLRPVITPPGPLNIYTGDSLTLQVTAFPGFSYEWSTGDTGTTCIATGPGNYTVTATNLNGCPVSATINIQPGIVLPVSLTSFTAVHEGDHVGIYWTTASETENDYFSIERLQNELWQVIGGVEGTGNSSIINHYRYNDHDPLAGTAYYRLKQTDFNGDFAYSPIVSVKVKTGNWNLYPVPARDFIWLESEADLHIGIYDDQGRLVLIIYLTEGKNTISITSLRNGLYTVRSTGYESSLLSFIKE